MTSFDRPAPDPADERPQLFQTIEHHLAGDPRYSYDVNAGLARLHRTLAQHPSRAGRTDPTSHSDGHAVPVLGSGRACRIRTGPARRAIDERRARLVVTPLMIASTISPEVARRLADGLHGQRWTVSWLPEQVCTRSQALAAMVLDELLTDPGDLDSATIMQIVHELARELGLPMQETLMQLSTIKNRPGYPLHRWSRHRTDLPGAASG